MMRKILFSLFFLFSFFVLVNAEEPVSLQSSSDSVTKLNTNAGVVASDLRVKNDIRPFIDGLNVLTKLNPIHYIYNGKGGSPKDMAGIGLVAQDIKDIIPYTVSTYKDKLNPEDKEEINFYNFNSAPLTFVLINAVKEQQAQIEALKVEIKQLKEELKPTK